MVAKRAHAPYTLATDIKIRNNKTENRNKNSRLLGLKFWGVWNL